MESPICIHVIVESSRLAYAPAAGVDASEKADDPLQKAAAHQCR